MSYKPLADCQNEIKINKKANCGFVYDENILN